MLRVSSSMIYNRLLTSINRNLSAIDRLNTSLSSGLRINRPSDDPTGMYLSMAMKSRLARNESYQRDITAASTVLESADTAVTGARDSLIRANELAIQFANATYTAQDRRLGAAEAREIQQEVVALANKKAGDRYIFSGYQTDVPAYARTLRIHGDQISIDSTNNRIVFDDNTGSGPFTVTIPQGDYTPDGLAAAVETALNDANPANADAYAVTYDAANRRYRISNAGGGADEDLVLMWNDAGSTAAAILGFDMSGADTVTVAGAPAVSDTAVSAGGNMGIVFTDGTGTYTATLRSGFYTPEELAAEVKRAMEEAASSTDGTYKVSFDYLTGRFSFMNTDDADSLTLHWTSAGSTAASALGFDTAADTVIAAGGKATGSLSATYERGFDVTSENNTVMVDFGAGPVAVTIPANAYTGDGLAAALKQVLEAADPGDTYSVTYDTGSHRFSITNASTNDAVTLVWTNAGTTAAGLFGFSADQTLDPGVSAVSARMAALSSSYVYQGDQGQIMVPSGPGGLLVTMNIPGSEIFDDALAALDTFIDSLESNDTAGIQTAISRLSSSLENMFASVAKVGGRLNRLDNDVDRIDQESVEVRSALSDIQDADVLEATINLSRYQTALEALRAAGFQQTSRSLFDFLR